MLSFSSHVEAPHSSNMCDGYQSAQCVQPAGGVDAFVRGGFRPLPGPHGIAYFLVRFTPHLFDADLFAQYGIACPDTIQASVTKRKAEFLAGRICAAKALDDHGHPTRHVGIGAHRSPLWPAGVIGSISHNAEYAAAVVVADTAFAGIGIDTETIVNDELRAVLELQAASAQEIAILLAQGQGFSANSLLTVIFSAKESFFKAAYTQAKEYFGFDAVRLVTFDQVEQRLQFRIVQTLSPKLMAGTLFDAYFDFLGDNAVITAVILQVSELASASS